MCVSLHLLLCLSVYLSVYLSLCLSLYFSHCLSVFVCLSLSLYVCLSVCSSVLLCPSLFVHVDRGQRTSHSRTSEDVMGIYDTTGHVVSQFQEKTYWWPTDDERMDRNGWPLPRWDKFKPEGDIYCRGLSIGICTSNPCYFAAISAYE